MDYSNDSMVQATDDVAETQAPCLHFACSASSLTLCSSQRLGSRTSHFRKRHFSRNTWIVVRNLWFKLQAMLQTVRQKPKSSCLAMTMACSIGPLALCFDQQQISPKK